MEQKMLEDEEVNKILDYVEKISNDFIGENESVIINSLLNLVVKFSMHFEIPCGLIVEELKGCMEINEAIKGQLMSNADDSVKH
jgi:hypothetical protein